MQSVFVKYVEYVSFLTHLCADGTSDSVVQQFSWTTQHYVVFSSSKQVLGF